MIIENKNQKDSATDLSLSLKDTAFFKSYTKTNKLITALYMVTDIIDKQEPIKTKLRSLGAEIISDMHSLQQTNSGYAASTLVNRISETVSFLDIASAMSFISEMNSNILKKEFNLLKESIAEHSGVKPNWLEDVFANSNTQPEQTVSQKTFSVIPPIKSERQNSGKDNGHQPSVRIGLQKGSTLLKALSDTNLSNTKLQKAPPQNQGQSSAVLFDVLKKQRRNDIVNVIKIIGDGATIKDIRDKVSAHPDQAKFLVSCGEKTLQRELISMLKDDVLYKTGEKRWSRYFVKK